MDESRGAAASASSQEFAPAKKPLASDDLRLAVELRRPLPDEAEALRRRQLAGIRKFLETVLANREEAGLSGSRGSLPAQSNPPDLEEKIA